MGVGKKNKRHTKGGLYGRHSHQRRIAEGEDSQGEDNFRKVETRRSSL